jgi:hypothetical protein
MIAGADSSSSESRRAFGLILGRVGSEFGASASWFLIGRGNLSKKTGRTMFLTGLE